MKTRYIDPYAICPFYSYDETSKVRKIHCIGYKKGVYVHFYFNTKALKKEHKKKYCNSYDYKNCPLCKGNLVHLENGGNE